MVGWEGEACNTKDRVNSPLCQSSISANFLVAEVDRQAWTPAESQVFKAEMSLVC